MPGAHTAQMIDMAKGHWHVFNHKGVQYSIIRYTCDIDIGDASLVLCGNNNYGSRESKIMETHIANRVQVECFYEFDHSSSVFKALLALKPHQETPHGIMFFD